MVRLKALVAVPPPDAWTVKLYVLAVVGVPLNTPPEDRLNPGGSEPEITDQV
jgi:hypothetical protein